MNRSPQALFERWNQGESLTAIGREVGMHRSTVAAHIRSVAPNGYKRPRWAWDDKAHRRSLSLLDMEARARARLLERVVFEPNGCWTYTGGVKAGRPEYGFRYGSFSYNGRSDYAHRASYKIYKGCIPTGLCVCHTCDNPLCVNPEHLELGTQSSNIRDRDDRGRQAHGWFWRTQEGTSERKARLRASQGAESLLEEQDGTL